MSDAIQNIPLTDEQEKKMQEILERIRSGLKLPVDSPFEEPAHIFVPGGFDVSR